MFHSAGYRLTFHPAHVFCPLCTLPGNSRVPLQPCCRYQGEVCPQSHIELPVNSLMALRSHSYGFPAESLNMPSFSPHHLQSSTADISHTQPARTSGEDISSNNVRDDLRQQRHTVSNKKKRRKRTIFTCEQLNRLESEFADQQYMVGAERQQLADALNLSETQIKIWFQNRRIKWRKENKQDYPDFLASAFSAMAYEARHPTTSTEAWRNDGGGNLGSSNNA